MMEVVKDPGSHQNRFFVDLVNDYQGMLLHMWYVFFRDKELAKDALQETFLKAYRGLNTFRGESNVKTWLIQIAINTCIEEYANTLSACLSGQALFTYCANTLSKILD